MKPSEMKLCSVDLSNTDWKLLRKQKKGLLLLLDKTEYLLSAKKSLDGLLNFIDYIQDEAAKQIGEKNVFGK
jgi:hypothetical protein